MDDLGEGEDMMEERSQRNAMQEGMRRESFVSRIFVQSYRELELNGQQLLTDCPSAQALLMASPPNLTAETDGRQPELRSSHMLLWLEFHHG